MPGEGEGEIGGGGGGTLNLGAPKPDGDAAASLQERLDRAEETIEKERARAAALEKDLAAAMDALRAADRRRRLERALMGLGARDVEAAAALVEKNIEGQTAPDLGRAARELARRRPELFTRPAAGPGVMGPNAPDPRPAHAAGPAAAADRRLVMSYMRSRRA
ncbi:MAG: hypothetical protein JNM07_10415 [Phycisphaerae bacterium]|nr:hypothetical protein [Phycisphaerae bacterium]